MQLLHTRHKGSEILFKIDCLVAGAKEELPISIIQLKIGILLRLHDSKDIMIC